LDIISIDGLVGTFGEIETPHPRMHERAFVLAPLAELAPEWRHGRLDQTASQLLAALPQASRYRRVGELSWPDRL
jgi:2-amino-4-hydroxy-6-hydroxymethyldihydropteridine diphosphokinase